MPTRDEKKDIDNPWRDQVAVERRKIQDVELTKLVYKAHNLQRSKPLTTDLGRFNGDVAINIAGASPKKEISGPFDFFERKPPKKDYMQDLLSKRFGGAKDQNESDDASSNNLTNSQGAFFLTATADAPSVGNMTRPVTAPLATTILRRTLEEDLANWHSDSSSAGTRTPRHDTVSVEGSAGPSLPGEARPGTAGSASPVPQARRRGRGNLDFRANPLPPLLRVRPAGVELLTRDEKLTVISEQGVVRRRHIKEVQTFAKIAQREKEEEVMDLIQRKMEKAEWNLQHKNWKERQRKTLGMVALALVTTKMRSIQVFKVIWKKKNDAAMAVQAMTRKFLWRCRIAYLRHVRRILGHVSWRAKLWLCCARRRVCARLVRTFLKDFSDAFLGYVIMTFRWKMLKLQRCIRDFLACKAARIVVLKKLWAREGRLWLDNRIEEKRQAFLVKQRRRIEPGTLEHDIHKRSKKIQDVVPRVLHVTHKLEAMAMFHQSGASKDTKIMHIKKAADKRARRVVRRMKVEDEDAPELSKAAETLLLTWFLESQRNSFCAGMIHARAEKAKRDSIINFEDAQNLLLGKRRDQDDDGSKPSFLLYTSLAAPPDDPHNPELRQLYERIGDDRARLFSELRREKRMKRILQSMGFEAPKKSAYNDRNLEGEEKIRSVDATFAEFLKPASPMSAQLSPARSMSSRSFSSTEATPSNRANAGRGKSPFFPADAVEEQPSYASSQAVDQALAESFEVDLTEVQELREIFELVDTDCGGSIDAEELEKLLGMLGNPKSRMESESFIYEVDTTGTGELGFADFATFLLRKKPVKYTGDAIVRAFQNLRPQFDESKSSNYISRDTLMRILTEKTSPAWVRPKSKEEHGPGQPKPRPPRGRFEQVDYPGYPEYNGPLNRKPMLHDSYGVPFEPLSYNEAAELVRRCEIFTVASPNQFDYEDYVRAMMMRAVENDDFTGVSIGTWLSLELQRKQRENFADDNGSLMTGAAGGL